MCKFDADKILSSIISETGLDRSIAEEVTIKTLRTLCSYDLHSMAAPHIREIVCGVMSSMKLHSYRNSYTRLGMPIRDVKKLLSENTTKRFKYLWLQCQVIEEYIHLNGIDEDSSKFINDIKKSASKLSDFEKFRIFDSIESALTLYNEKQLKSE